MKKKIPSIRTLGYKGPYIFRIDTKTDEYIVATHIDGELARFDTKESAEEFVRGEFRRNDRR